MNMLRRYQLEQTQTPMRPAITALLDAAPRRLRHRMRVNNFIDHHRARVDPFRELTSAPDIARKHRRSQTVNAVVRQPDSLVVRLESHDRQHWPKRLFHHDLHRVIDIRDDGRLMKPPITIVHTTATGLHSRAFLQRITNMTLDDL